MKHAAVRLVLAGFAWTIAAAQSTESRPETPISPKGLAIDILRDQKPIWTFAPNAVRGGHWKPALGVALGTAALIALDPHIESHIHDRPGFSAYKTGPLRG